MTRNHTLELPTLQGATVGFDRLFNELDRQFANTKNTGYPPYNLVEHSENEWSISIAVAGFREQDLNVSVNRNVLKVEGSIPEDNSTPNYLHKGIAGRAFTREFTLADHVYIDDVTLDLGILTVYLKREVPEEFQPRSFKINSSGARLGNDTAE